MITRREVPDDVDFPADVHPVLARCYAARGVTGPAALGRELTELADDRGMPDIERAAELLAAALGERRRIVIVGDYDADGATATAVAIAGLRALGADEVVPVMPDRARHGYGLSPTLVSEYAELAPALMITVDNGVAAVAGVAAAKAAGFDVIVTDHHLPGEQLPAADALVDPCLPGSGFASPAIAGVGVMFYLLIATRRVLGSRVQLASLLDLVALGTVADVVPLDRNNRILVHQGLGRMRRGRSRPGIEALARVARKDLATITATDLAFGLAPRLNAAGRLEDIRIGLDCLLAEDPAEAHRLAQQLDAINRERRAVEADMRAQAEQAVEQQLRALAGELPDGLVLHDPGWHPGVVGLVASRLKERFHRPVVAFAPAGDGELKGSARSIPGLHLRDLLARVDARHPELIRRFGGHAMAAGLSLDPQLLSTFRDALLVELAEVLDPAVLTRELLSDGELSPDELCLATAVALRDGGPWGQAFPEPCFDGVFDVVRRREVGSGHLKLQLRPSAGGSSVLDAIAFGRWDDPAAGADRLQLVYRLGVDSWSGVPRAQLVVEELHAAD